MPALVLRGCACMLAALNGGLAGCATGLALGWSGVPLGKVPAAASRWQGASVLRVASLAVPPQVAQWQRRRIALCLAFSPLQWTTCSCRQLRLRAGGSYARCAAQPVVSRAPSAASQPACCKGVPGAGLVSRRQREGAGNQELKTGGSSMWWPCCCRQRCHGGSRHAAERPACCGCRTSFLEQSMPAVTKQPEP